MAVLEFLWLEVFVSITCCGNTVTQASEFECRVPDDPPIDHVHTNLSEGEFALLQIEGHCFLTCTTETYSNEIGMSNYSLSSYWPFISINQADCMTAFKVHECTRGCLYRHRNATDTRECRMKCQETCHSVLELQSCDLLFECHPWISLKECQKVCDQIPTSHPFHPCLHGCATDNLQQDDNSAPPRDPIGLPLLIQDRSTAEQFKFIVDLSGAVPQAEKCEPISNPVDISSVAFLFKFVEINSSNVSYKWTVYIAVTATNHPIVTFLNAYVIQANPFEHLDLADYACQELLVSFAVSNKEGLSNFSTAISMTINGDEQLIPVPPINLQISEEIDTRAGFFGHVILYVSWDAQQNYSHLDYFLVSLSRTTACLNKSICGCKSWIGSVQGKTFLSIEAESVESLPVMSCSYDIQIHFIGRYGVSHPLRETYDISTEFDAQNISFDCLRWWHSAEVNELSMISFNVTWVLPAYISSSYIISSFVIDLQLINIREDITILIGNTAVPFPQESSMNVTKSLEFIAHNLNMTFLNNLLYETSWLYHLVAQVTWNTSSIPYVPKNHTTTCVESTLYPVPGPIEDLNITSCSTNGSHTTLHLEWSPPPVVSVELVSYEICIGESLEHDQDPGPNNGSHQCSNLTLNNKQLTQTAIHYHAKTSSYTLYVQIRAHTLYTTGNWSELQYDLSTCHQEIASSYSVGVIIGISVISSIALICLIGLAMWIIKMLQRRSKLYRTTQGPHDPMFSGRVRRFPLERSLTSPQKLDKWEIPSNEIIVKELLGEGAFGEVYRGIIKCPIVSPKRRSSMNKSIFTSVAIKRLKPSSSGNERKDFLSEMEMMKKVAEGQNAHVVRLIGCVTIKEPLTLIIEFVQYGDLLSYLRTNRKMCTGTNTEDDERDDAYVELGDVSPVDLISFAYQITSGMEYLSSLGIVHRDLACRNILVDEGKVLKITDFGLSRETDEIYVQKRTGRVPLKWMAIESIIAREFTSASDVWSFGVVLWEIGTLGGIPYPSILNDDLLSMLKRGYRMEKPDNCSPEVYDIMLICWNEQPKERPAFKELRAKFDAMLLAEKKDTYIALCIDESKSYYYQSLPPVTTKDEISASCTSLNTNQKSVCSSKDYSVTDRNLSTKKLADFRQSSISLDEVHTADRRAEVSNHGNRTIRLSLQLFTDDQQGESENRYVKSPMTGVLVATSPALSPTINLESEGEIEMKSVKQNNPKIEISVTEPQN